LKSKLLSPACAARRRLFGQQPMLAPARGTGTQLEPDPGSASN